MLRLTACALIVFAATANNAFACSKPDCLFKLPEVACCPNDPNCNFKLEGVTGDRPSSNGGFVIGCTAPNCEF